MTLSRHISTWTLLTSAIAGIVGSGWLLGPLVCARIAGPASILTWIIAGILISIVASTFVLLVKNMPVTGGTVRFFQLTYGDFASFNFSWVAWLAWIAVSPIETMALIQYSSNYIPELMTQTAEPVLTSMGLCLAIGLMVFITVINSHGMKIYSRLNTFILFFKLAIPVTTVILLISTQFHTRYFVESGFMPYGIHSVFVALPLAGVIYSFIGFNPAIQLAAESENPKRAIPIAVFGALGVCMVLYTLIQVAFVGALPSELLSNGWVALSFTGDHGPFVGLLVSLGFVWFVKALYADAVISPFGTGMVQAMATARLTYAMGENRYLPSFVKKLNQHQTPIYAMLVNLVIGFAFFLPFPSWQHMVGFLVSCLVLGYVVGPMSLGILSRQHANRFAPLSPVFIQGLSIIAFYICNLMIFWAGWSIMMKVAILFGIGYGVLLLKWCFDKPEQRLQKNDVIRGSWVIVYIIGMSVISYYSTFGGTNSIPFGLDFLLLAMFSVFIYGLAQCLVRSAPLFDRERLKALAL